MTNTAKTPKKKNVLEPSKLEESEEGGSNQQLLYLSVPIEVEKLETSEVEQESKSLHFADHH